MEDTFSFQKLIYLIVFYGIMIIFMCDYLKFSLPAIRDRRLPFGQTKKTAGR